MKEEQNHKNGFKVIAISFDNGMYIIPYDHYLEMFMAKSGDITRVLNIHYVKYVCSNFTFNRLLLPLVFLCIYLSYLFIRDSVFLPLPLNLIPFVHRFSLLLLIFLL